MSRVSKLRVLHFYKTCYPYSFGGVEQVIYQLCKGGVSHDIENVVLALSPDGNEDTLEIDGYIIHRVKQNFHLASTGFSLSAFKRFKELVSQVDIVHYHFPWPFMDIVHFATRIKKPTVVSYHSDIVRQKQLLKLYRPIKNKFLSSVDCIVAASPNYLQSSEVLARFKDKTIVIPYGLDKESYPSPSQEIMGKWRNIFGSRFFLFVGVLRYYKGLHIVLEASKGVDYPIVILGSGPIEQELKSQVKALGLRNVHFLGMLPEEDKVALLTLCYGVIFPSHLRSEAFGISLLEGAMFGKPMISCEIGSGTTFINVNGETGLAVPPGDSVAFRQAMQYLWEHPDEAAEMGKRAEERYWKHFTAEQMVKSYVDLYGELVGLHDGASR